LVNGLVKDVIDGWIITILLGSLFLVLQVMEYYESTYSFNDSVYGCTFYMLTGLHGMHVFVGVTFIFICLKRYLYKHFTTMHHLGFLFAAWY
jgi:cytochrome c oxidase subunit 3